MLGNTSEWVFDRYYNRYDEDDAGAAPEEPLAPNAAAVVRGGSWGSDSGSLRASNRAEMYPDAAEPVIGFRCAVDRM
jgi:formylglycine-generating enzyme required for sulfatase activity